MLISPCFGVMNMLVKKALHASSTLAVEDSMVEIQENVVLAQPGVEWIATVNVMHEPNVSLLRTLARS